MHSGKSQCFINHVENRLFADGNILGTGTIFHCTCLASTVGYSSQAQAPDAHRLSRSASKLPYPCELPGEGMGEVDMAYLHQVSDEGVSLERDLVSIGSP